MRLLYQGMLRTLLVLLHDFPEFLSDYHLSFCDVIPPMCIQLRNLVLAAFPRSMRLPDPFTPNLKVRRRLSYSADAVAAVVVAVVARGASTSILWWSGGQLCQFAMAYTRSGCVVFEDQSESSRERFLSVLFSSTPSL